MLQKTENIHHASKEKSKEREKKERKAERSRDERELRGC